MNSFHCISCDKQFLRSRSLFINIIVALQLLVAIAYCSETKKNYVSVLNHRVFGIENIISVRLGI